MHLTRTQKISIITFNLVTMLGTGVALALAVMMALSSGS